MKKTHTRLGFVLAILTGIALLAILVTGAFFPHIILPRPNGMAILLLSLAALTVDHYAYGERRHGLGWTLLYGALIFGVFPVAAFVATPLEGARLAVLGAVILTVCAFLFDSLVERLSSGPAAKAAPLIGAFGLYLAAQCLMGIL